MRNLVRSRALPAALGACVALCTPASASAADVLPDLVADPPVERTLTNEGGRLLLRFDAYIRNAGAGAAELVGAAPQGGVLTGMVQRIYDDQGGSRDVPSAAVVRYENHVNHSHFHLQSAARYSLWSEDRSREVLPSAKVGFCLTDSFHAEPLKGPLTREYAPTFCSQNNPTPSGEVIMGISAGWRDDYPSSLAYQWADVSDLAPGRYRLGADVDPDNFVIESDEANPVAFQDQVTVIPGYRPLPEDSGTVNPFVARSITLRAERLERAGTPTGQAAFAVTRPPSCGRLEAAALTGFTTDPGLVFTPGPSCRGSVEFEFAARDSTSAFPLQPPTATVSFRMGTRRALLKTRAARRGRKLRLRMRSRYAGRVRATLLKGGRRLGSCSITVLPGRQAVCAVRVPKKQSLRRARVRTVLRVNGRTVARRRDPL